MVRQNWWEAAFRTRRPTVERVEPLLLIFYIVHRLSVLSSWDGKRLHILQQQQYPLFMDLVKGCVFGLRAGFGKPNFGNDLGLAIKHIRRMSWPWKGAAT